MTDAWTLRQREDEPEQCIEDGCIRSAYDGVRCKFHADLAAYREATGGQPGERRHATLRHAMRLPPSAL